jgi:hypothetical protein
LETSRDFSAKTQGHIDNYVYKLEEICAKTAEWTGSRGFSARFARHRSDLRFTRKFSDLFAKLSGLSSSFGQERSGRER